MSTYITLAGEPAINTTWAKKLKDLNSDDKVIIMTKNPGAFINSELGYVLEQHKDIITLYCTITGYAKTSIEPDVPSMLTSVLCMKTLHDKGYNVVLHINPIIPTNVGFNNMVKVISYTEQTLGSLENFHINFDFIKSTEHDDKRGLSYPWLTPDWSNLPIDDDIDNRYVSINTIVEFFLKLEYDKKCIIHTKNVSIKIPNWTNNIITDAIELLEGNDINHQCKYGCRYCYHSDYNPEVDENNEL